MPEMPEMTKDEVAKAIRSNRRQAVKRYEDSAKGAVAREEAAVDRAVARENAAVARAMARQKAALDRAMGKKQGKDTSGLRGGGMIKMGYKKGGSVKSIDGIAQRGKTRGTMR